MTTDVFPFLGSWGYLSTSNNPTSSLKTACLTDFSRFPPVSLESLNYFLIDS